MILILGPRRIPRFFKSPSVICINTSKSICPKSPRKKEKKRKEKKRKEKKKKRKRKFFLKNGPNFHKKFLLMKSNLFLLKYVS